MRRFALLAAAWAAVAHGQVTVSDDSGQVITLQGPATRIVALAPHVTELLYAAGAGPQVLASVEYANHPEAARKLPRVGSHAAFDLERIAALKPDLAIAWGSGNPAAQVAQVRKLGIPVFISEPQRLSR